MYTRMMIAVLLVAAVAVNTAMTQSNTTASLPTNTTAAPATNATASLPTNTTAAPATNATAAPATNATAAPATNATAAPATNATAAPATNATTASNTTTSSATTAVLNPVGSLTASLSKAGCGTQQLCLSQPASCDPSTSGSCYFFSSQQISGQTYQLGLSGTSSGYIATALSTTGTVGNNDTTFICANNKGNVEFFTATLNGVRLQITPLSVSSVKGRVNGNTIQCLFNATLPSASTKALTLLTSVLTGSYNATSGELGNATIQFNATADLSNPSSHAITFKQSLTQAVLIVAVALGLTM